MNKILVQTQLSNYDTKGMFILEADSGWQMTMGRVRVMLEKRPNLEVHVMCPLYESCVTIPEVLNKDLCEEFPNRIKFIQHPIIPNALVTRYDFDWTELAFRLGLGTFQNSGPTEDRYEAVYINDPMHLRNFRAMFHIVAKYTPRFYVHSHFIDNPECPKFPQEASLWLGQCEAAIKADYNFWQCESSMNTFFDSMSKTFDKRVVEEVIDKSMPWDDGYSITEITTPVDESTLRFNPRLLEKLFKGKKVIFVPNRIGGKGRSSDYTNCGNFMFEMLPKIKELLGDSYVVIAGNPSQKFLNSELTEMCGENNYVSVVEDSLRRDEFKWIASRADVAIGLYDQDTYGGTAARECIQLGCFPLWLKNFEYERLAEQVGPEATALLAKTLSDVPRTLQKIVFTPEHILDAIQKAYVGVVKSQCSYESTTTAALDKMKL